MNCHKVSGEDIVAARKKREESDPRDLSYKTATILVELAWNGSIMMSLAEAIAVLLRDWNSAYYRYKGSLKEVDYQNIEILIEQNKPKLNRFRGKSIEELASEDEQIICALFSEFQDILGGPVGAAKALHLLAPRFFPLWDTRIAGEYGLRLGNKVKNVSAFMDFMRCTKLQCEQLRIEGITYEDLLKRLDEFNFCTITLPALEAGKVNRRKEREEQRVAK